MKWGMLPRLRPTVNAAALALLLVAAWYAGASQSNGAAYLLLFFLAGITLASIPHSLLNLSGIKVLVEAAKPVFAGQEISIPLEVVNQSSRSRNAISIRLERSDSAAFIGEVKAGGASRVSLRFLTGSRGEFELPKLRVESAYPIGVLSTWRRTGSAQRYLVYPRPAGDPALPQWAEVRAGSQSPPAGGEGGDFAGVRPYIPGESQRHIDWKAVARGQPPATKQFTTESSGMLAFDLDQTPGATLEERISQLALWVLEAGRQQLFFELRLGAQRIPAGVGDAHSHACLRALALHA
jgi:uncharacterized protein (DUF58 family)